MRACVLALFAVALGGCSTQIGEADLSDVRPSSSARQSKELSNFAQSQPAPPVTALNALDADTVFNSLAPEVTVSSTAVVPQRGPAEPAPKPQAESGSSNGSGDLARASDDMPEEEALTPSSAYAPPARRVANRTQVKLAGYAPGTVVVRTKERRLYLVLADGQALRYPVAVGKTGQVWVGASYIYSKRIRPPWSPPNDMKQDNPALPDVIPGGAPSNPMGDAALLIAAGEYAIHGTNRPESIGRFVSYGCIRMYNEEVLDLYQKVKVGTMVVVER